MNVADHQSDEGDPELSILANAFLWDRKVSKHFISLTGFNFAFVFSA